MRTYIPISETVTRQRLPVATQIYLKESRWKFHTNIFSQQFHLMFIHVDLLILGICVVYRVSRRECARLRENVPYVKVHRSNPKHLYPKSNGYGDNGERKVWSSCGSTYCTCTACCYPYTAHVRPSFLQPSQAHSFCDFIINRCHSYSELWGAVKMPNLIKDIPLCIYW